MHQYRVTAATGGHDVEAPGAPGAPPVLLSALLCLWISRASLYAFG
jgi:hypothetical protein